VVALLHQDKDAAARSPPDDHHLRPLTTFVAVVHDRLDVGRIRRCDVGSVMQNAERIARQQRSSHCAFTWRAVALDTSMLPVSTEQ
jgi:hypothetical protein